MSSTVPLTSQSASGSGASSVSKHADRSSSRKSLLRVIAMVVVAFGGLELLTRTWLFNASKDFSRFQTFPKRAAALHNEEGTRIALIGNSLTERGIDCDLLGRELVQREGSPVVADAFCADASRINSWHYMANRFFYRTDQTPDWLIVSFYNDNLADGTQLEIGRFAQFFVDTSDWPEVFEHELTTSKQRLDFLLSSVWATYAASDRIKERVLELAIPKYEHLTVRLNEVARTVQSKEIHERAVTHQLLQRFLTRANEHHVKVIFVAAPIIIPEQTQPYVPYELYSDAIKLMRANNAEFLDLRQVPGLTHEMFADDIHLNAAGKELYTRHLAELLSPIIRRSELKPSRSSAL